MARTKPKTVDAYLARLNAEQRAALQQLRKNIRAAIPRAEEIISYQMPAYRLDGRVVVWFGAAKNHCSFYPGGTVAEFDDELRDYQTSKGTIRFTPDHPLSAALVKKIVKARVRQIKAG